MVSLSLACAAGARLTAAAKEKASKDNSRITARPFIKLKGFSAAWGLEHNNNRKAATFRDRAAEQHLIPPPVQTGSGSAGWFFEKPLSHSWEQMAPR
jgi:hypothetical protein